MESLDSLTVGIRCHLETARRASLFLSAGHSDSDPGAVGNGHTEADIVLAFRDKSEQATSRK
jgi:N-acetylmuramoyl-L-alanine amidase